MHGCKSRRRPRVGRVPEGLAEGRIFQTPSHPRGKAHLAWPGAVRAGTRQGGAEYTAFAGNHPPRRWVN